MQGHKNFWIPYFPYFDFKPSSIAKPCENCSCFESSTDLDFSLTTYCDMMDFFQASAMIGTEFP